MMLPIVIYTKKDFFLVNEIDNEIEIFKSAGLIEFWDFKSNDHKVTGSMLNPLTLDHLNGSFQILLIGSVVSLIVFVMELLIPFIKTIYPFRLNSKG